MSEQPPNQKQSLPEELGAQSSVSGHEPNSKLTYKEYLEQGGEFGQKFRNRLAEESGADQTDKTQSESAMELVPVQEGELETKGGRVTVGEGKDQDTLPVAVMAHEPGGLDVKEPSKKTIPPQEPSDPTKEPGQPEAAGEGDPSDGSGKPGTGSVPPQPPGDITPFSETAKVVNDRIDELKG